MAGLRAGMQVMMGHDGLQISARAAYDDVTDIARGVRLFFVISKTLGIVLLPTNFMIELGLIGVILLATRWRRFGRGLIIVALVLLAICGWSPLGKLLLYPLETRFPAWDAARGAPDGI